MEFFQEVAAPNMDAARLKDLLAINNLPRLCASIDSIISMKGDEADIYCLWGSFQVQRLEIRHGVRFSLLNCPHSLAWTVTFNENKKSVVIHCTIDSERYDTDTDFIDSIYVFMNHWAEGVASVLESRQQQAL